MKLIKKIEEKIEIQKEARKLTKQYFDIFDSNRYTGYLSKNKLRWQSYTDQRGCWATYRPNRGSYESWKATEKTVKRYIKNLLDLRKKSKIQYGDIEIMALAAIMDEIDYSFSSGLMFHPSPVDHIEDWIFEAINNKVLVRIVNSLVKQYNIDPFEIESKIQDLYYQDTIRFLNKSWRYTAGLAEKCGFNKRQEMSR